MKEFLGYPKISGGIPPRFHFSCVGLDAAPTGAWRCDACAAPVRDAAYEDDGSEGYCVCGGGGGGEMVACSSGGRCPDGRGWFHFACAGLAGPPPAGRWYCSTCSAKKATHCWCDRVDDGAPMVECAAGECARPWHHYACVGLKEGDLGDADEWVSALKAAAGAATRRVVKTVQGERRAEAVYVHLAVLARREELARARAQRRERAPPRDEHVVRPAVGGHVQGMRRHPRGTRGRGRS